MTPLKRSSHIPTCPSCLLEGRSEEEKTVVAYSLCFLEGEWISSFACIANCTANTFSLSRWSNFFYQHWVNSLNTGDRIDAMDTEGRWLEASIKRAEADRTLIIHYHSWNSNFDQRIHSSSSSLQPSLAPLFSQSNNWRPHLKRRTVIEAKHNSSWYLAIILDITYTSKMKWTHLAAVQIDASRQNETLRISVPKIPMTYSRNLLRWEISDFYSEDIAALGTHIRPAETGKDYATNNLSMPMSFFIDLMTTTSTILPFHHHATAPHDLPVSNHDGA